MSTSLHSFITCRYPHDLMEATAAHDGTARITLPSIAPWDLTSPADATAGVQASVPQAEAGMGAAGMPSEAAGTEMVIVVQLGRISSRGSLASRVSTPNPSGNGRVVQGQIRARRDSDLRWSASSRHECRSGCIFIGLYLMRFTYTILERHSLRAIR